MNFGFQDSSYGCFASFSELREHAEEYLKTSPKDKELLDVMEDPSRFQGPKSEGNVEQEKHNSISPSNIVACTRMMLSVEEDRYALMACPQDVKPENWKCCMPPCKGLEISSSKAACIQITQALMTGRANQSIDPNQETTINSPLVPVKSLSSQHKSQILKINPVYKGKLDNLFICPSHFQFLEVPNEPDAVLTFNTNGFFAQQKYEPYQCKLNCSKVDPETAYRLSASSEVVKPFDHDRLDINEMDQALRNQHPELKLATKETKRNKIIYRIDGKIIHQDLKLRGADKRIRHIQRLDKEKVHMVFKSRFDRTRQILNTVNDDCMTQMGKPLESLPLKEYNNAINRFLSSPQNTNFEPVLQPSQIPKKHPQNRKRLGDDCNPQEQSKQPKLDLCAEEIQLPLTQGSLVVICEQSTVQISPDNMHCHSQEDLRNSIVNLTLERDKLKKERDSPTELAKHYEAKFQELKKSTEAEMERLQNENTKLIASEQKLLKEKHFLTSHIERLTQENEDLEKNKNDQQRAYAKLQNDHSESKTRLEKENENLLEDKAKLAKVNSLLTESNSGLEREKQNLIKDKKGLEQQLEKKKEDYNKIRKTNRRLVGENEELKSNRKTYNESKDKEIEKLKNSNTKLRQTIKSHEQVLREKDEKLLEKDAKIREYRIDLGESAKQYEIQLERQKHKNESKNNTLKK